MELSCCLRWTGGAAGQLTVIPTTPISGDTNLDVEGNLDWEQIGYPTNSSSVNRKPATPNLGTITPIGNGTVFPTTTPAKTFTMPSLVDITSPNDPVTRVDGTDNDAESGVPPVGEEEFHAFDDTTQKYLNFLDLNSGVIVTPQASNGNGTVINAMLLVYRQRFAERDPRATQSKDPTMAARPGRASPPVGCACRTAAIRPAK